MKFKNAVVSSVVAVVCARHGFFLPQGMVDLSKGERCVAIYQSTPIGPIFIIFNSFVNTDYALAHALSSAEDL
jgi:ABC-type microcin C transport system permease subunit YejE